MSARSIRRSRIIGSTVAALVALVGVVGAAAPVAAEPPAPVARYVALGDSYAAGQGAAAPLDACLRSSAAYPVLLDAEPRTNLLRFAACSGADIADVAATQLSQVNRGTTLVTLTVGGNDLDVGAVFAVCAPDPDSLACATAVIEAQQLLASGTIGDDLASLLLAIADRAPRAHIVVTDYPVPFVNGLSTLTDTVNAATASLDAQIQAAAAAAGAAGADVEYRSLALAYLGHQVGDADPWLGADQDDPLTFLHPTAVGQGVYRDAILTALAN
ncbi:SGNH/GDSL hydrolase family protein [Agromyces aurantiacus]|uniref:SGNH/GDSL hydrolase family protein n=1 Tax=Agromyces aurantiacus TaxID=165814 RepID=A0ABV9R789_9MICO|nr:SGNH/GDSL hydrolase family protein [Agromyces aurantiacus]MBM7504034.1 lysophospholipase L1-like esterase [Agromyces aurantiacus]